MAFLTFCGVKKVDSCGREPCGCGRRDCPRIGRCKKCKKCHVGVRHVGGEEEVAPGYHIEPLHIHATPEVRSVVW